LASVTLASPAAARMPWYGTILSPCGPTTDAEDAVSQGSGPCKGQPGTAAGWGGGCGGCCRGSAGSVGSGASSGAAGSVGSGFPGSKGSSATTGLDAQQPRGVLFFQLILYGVLSTSVADVFCFCALVLYLARSISLCMAASMDVNLHIVRCCCRYTTCASAGGTSPPPPYDMCERGTYLCDLPPPNAPS
jgi:hypothetical protein